MKKCLMLALLSLSLQMLMPFCSTALAESSEAENACVAAGKAGYNQAPTELGCCEGLEENAVGKCDEPDYQDPAAVSSQCGAGLELLPQTTQTLYAGLYPTPDSEEVQTMKQQELEAQVSEVGNPKSPGQACNHSRECLSYSCVSGVCEDKKICRKGIEGEAVSANGSCGPNLVRNPSGMCERSPEAQNGTYLGLLNEVTMEPIGQCQYQLNEESRKQAMVAMKSLRAMEWMLSTITLENSETLPGQPVQSEECFDVLPVVKEEIGNKYLTARKNILNNFTDVLNGIEGDFKKVVSARKEGTDTLVVHGDSIAEADLATRQTSGFDTLVLMKRRNLLFQSYENAMLETVNEANATITALNERLSALRDNTELPACASSWYRRKRPLHSWKTKYYTKVKDHWATQYEVKGNIAANADIVKRDGVKNVLAIIGGTTSEEAVARFTQDQYFLMDLMMFGGMNNGSYGPVKPLERDSSWFGLGGFKDKRKAWYLNGVGTGTYTKMYNDLKPQIQDFYRSLKINAEQTGFVYEPELLTTGAKDCLDSNANAEGCADFQKFLDDVQDETFAHFLAFGYSTKDSYREFFSNAETYRLALLRKLMTDMSNISKYYTTVIEYRNQQNTCIETVMNGLADSGILSFDSSGLNEGGVPTRGAELKNGSSRSRLSPGSMSRLTRSRFAFNLRGNGLSSLNEGALNDNVVGSGISSGSAGVSGSGSASMAGRDALDRANAKAKSSGVKIENKEKAVREVVKSMNPGKGTNNGLALGSRTSGMGNPPFGAGNAGTARVSIDSEEKSSDAPEGISGNAGEVGLNGNSKNGYENESGMMGGYTKKKKDLSDKDKARVFSEYERNKEDYEGKENDGLFKKLSKAYMRNLDRVLNKKKEIER